MTSISTSRRTALWLRSLRAVTGLYLLAYVTMHLINLSLGLISLEAMDAARPYLSQFWSGPVLGVVLGGALLIHYLTGLWALYTRPRISGTAQDLVQALSGLLVLPLMAVHLVGVWSLKNANVPVDYLNINRLFWLSDPALGLTQVLLISVVWVHGCAGLFTLLRARAGARHWLPWLYPIAVAVPVLALLGYTQAGRAVLAEGLPPVFAQQPLSDGSMPTPLDYAWVTQATNWVIYTSVAMALLVLGARALRHWLGKPARVTLHTFGVGTLEAQTGQTLLDGLRAGGQPHANLCAGRGRCGTCAVRLMAGAELVSPPEPLETATLERVNHGPSARLACQLRLERGGRVELTRVLPPDYTFDAAPPERPKERPTEVAS